MDSYSETPEIYEDDYELLGALKLLTETENASGLESDAFIQTLISVGKLLNERGEYLEALGYFIQGRGVLEAREEQLHPLMSELLAGMGEHYLLQGMLVEALPFYQKSLAVREALAIGNTEESARFHIKAGEILCLQGELEDAKEHMLRAYQILNHLPIPDHFYLGDVTHNLGILLLTEEYFERAVDYFTEAAEHRSKYFGAGSLERADSLWGLGRCYLGTDSTTAALEQFYTAIALREEILGGADEVVKESKNFYRSLSGGAPINSSETTILEISDSPQLLHSDNDLLLALISAASLAVEKDEGELAGNILSLARGLLTGTQSLPPEMTAQILGIFNAPQSK